MAINSENHLMYWERVGQKFSPKNILANDGTCTEFDKISISEMNLLTTAKNGILMKMDKEQDFPIVYEEMLKTSITDISSSSNHHLALTSNNEVFTWGKVSNGQLGLGSFEADVVKVVHPKLVVGLEHEEIGAVYAGNSCSAVVTKEGSVYTSGINKHDKLGLGNMEKVESFTHSFVVNLSSFKCKIS